MSTAAGHVSTGGGAGRREALVVRGGWDGHSPIECTERFIPYLKDQGYTVTVTEDLDVYTDADRLAGTDLVVQCWTMGEITKEQAQGLSDAVKSGTGLAGWHGGIVDAFRGSAEYNFMTGGQFIAHPGGIIDYAVDIVPARADDPIVAGLGRFDVHTEQYYMHTDPSLDVLATTTFGSHPDYPSQEGVVMPVVWKRQWGRGRVFVSTIGHAPGDFDVPEARAITERGLTWASR